MLPEFSSGVNPRAVNYVRTHDLRRSIAPDYQVGLRRGACPNVMEEKNFFTPFAFSS